jgi:hypothetical protein
MSGAENFIHALVLKKAALVAFITYREAHLVMIKHLHDGDKMGTIE